MITLGITGTLGAGKGAVVEYLMGKGFSHFSVRAYLLHEVRRRGLPENRDSTTLVANDLRKTHAPDFLVRELFEQAKRAGGDAIIESIRALGEIDYLKKNAMPFYFIAVDADPQLRYLRIVVAGSIKCHLKNSWRMKPEKAIIPTHGSRTCQHASRGLILF